MSRSPSQNPLHWLEIRGRQAGSWAFMLNRLTALALTFYLFVHLIVLHRLTQGAQIYDSFVAFAQFPWIKVGEVLLIAAAVLHGLNGLRLILLAFGLGLRRQKGLFAIIMVLTILVTLLFGVRMFGA